LEVLKEDEDACSSSVIIPGRVGFPIPEICDGDLLHKRKGGDLLAIEVSEIHAYPSRPEGFEEPLFPTAASRKAVAEHLLKAPWLFWASELEGQTGGAAHALEEPIELKNPSGRVEVVRLVRGKRCGSSWRRRRVVRVLDRWRQVDRWWDENRTMDRIIFRVLLSGGAVIDLARERSGAWLLVGVDD
jgi:hypothetical protein